MATISYLNKIFEESGSKAAADYARASVELAWAAKKIEKGEWNPNGRRVKVSTHFPPRVGKTVRTGGRLAALARKREKSLESSKLRADMKGKTASGSKSASNGK